MVMQQLNIAPSAATQSQLEKVHLAVFVNTKGKGTPSKQQTQLSTNYKIKWTAVILTSLVEKVNQSMNDDDDATI